MQINRLFEIVYILLNKKVSTAKEFAEYFQVSTRTIYRDINTLSSTGIPIYTNQGKGGGIRILDNFILNKSLLSENEQNEILIALQSLKALKYPDIDTTLSKLSNLFKKDNYNWIEVDFSNWGSNKFDKEKFDILKEAVINNKIIAFKYYNSSGEKSNRKAQPLKLIFKDRSWYLQSFCLSKQNYRTFKISRMSNITITEEISNIISLDKLQIQSQREQAHKVTNFKLHFLPNAAYRIYDEFDEKDIVKNKDGSFNVITVLPEGEWIYDYIMSFGTGIEVLEPKVVRDILLEKLKKMIGKYK
ncbi:helix-turn-helix transcriptional regulator [Clostridium pasteurianum]|uniref:Putative transcriptional regulator n=1 Tax=Clostridium pasteurianum BC1 TaxID=86416 RepID=R4K4S1_CLOPA|nr:YafY family protein [Clostridium pasteurianum]AGK95509.1 putative transcriptional regulator [Clostridium pasteurianum BC1]